MLAFAWTAYPFTAYTLNANTNDTIMPAFLIFGFWLVSSDWARGASVALAGWTKFGALLVAPLWATYPTLELRRLARVRRRVRGRDRRSRSRSSCSSRLCGGAFATFWDRTVGFQAGRDSPFSIWGWGQYHARGIPDLGFLQPVVAVLAVALALVVAFVPREKGPVELAALTAAVLVAFQLTLTHWFYLYLPWILPFVAALAAAPRSREDSDDTEMRTDSIEDALPVSESQSMSAPSIRTSP